MATHWNQDQYIKAWHFAAAAHQGQTLPGSATPYIHHLGLVAMECMAAIAGQDFETPDLLVLCALLHDTIEDTQTTHQTLQQTFGLAVADGVLALSKNSGLPTKAERMHDSLARIKRQPKAIWMVKLADRICNLQPPPPHWDKPKIRNYEKEAILILDELHPASDFLAARLATKIAAYRQYGEGSGV